MRKTGPSPAVRSEVIDRDESRCVRCGRHVMNLPYSLHHRRPRGMGGTKRESANGLANLVLLCGDATSSWGCHYAVESDRLRGVADGFLVSQWADPELIPVKTWRGKALLSNDGMLALVAETDGAA